MSRPRSARAVALASLVLVASSCSLLDVPNEVGIRAVPVDLKFGALKQPKVEQPTIGELPPVPDIVLPDFNDDEPEAKPKPPPEICPVTKADAPENESRGEIISAEEMPREGPYFSEYQAHALDGTYTYTIGFKEVTAEENAEATGYTFSVQDVVPVFTGGGNAVVGMDMSFQVVYTRPEPEPDGMSLTRLVLRSVTEEGELVEYPFVPNPPIALVEFPIVQGSKLTREAVDVEGKEEGATNPITGQPILTPSGNNMKSVFEIGSREIIEVCADLAQAWRANWNIEITGDFNVNLSGAFWFDTSKGKGGMPIRNDYILTGDIEGGTFASRILRIDPGDFL